MTGAPAGDAQVQMLFGHLLTPQVTGETAKQPAARQMDVDAHSRKRQRQAKPQQPKGQGRGRAGRGGRRQDNREEDSSASSERELVLALGRIVLNQADQLHRLECDTGYFLVLATAPAPGTIIPTMFSVAELWRKQQADNPELLTCSLGVMMFRCLLQEMSNRLCHALKTKEVLEALMKQDMLTDKQDWRYMIWDKDNGKLAPDTTRNPLSTKELQATLQEAANLLQNTPEMLTRFSCTQRLEQETTNAMVPFLIDVTLRDSRLFQILHKWSRLSVWHLLNGRLRPARAKRSPAELRVMGMLKALS